MGDRKPVRYGRFVFQPMLPRQKAKRRPRKRWIL